MYIKTILCISLAQLKMDDDGERVLRSETHVPLVPIDIITRKRKPLTQQQLEERKKKVT